MLDITAQPHRITTDGRRDYFGGGFYCHCTCGQTFYSLKAAKAHAEVFNTQLQAPHSNLVQEVDMFPLLHVYYDRYTREFHAADAATLKILNEDFVEGESDG
jgi:hypothetical protein